MQEGGQRVAGAWAGVDTPEEPLVSVITIVLNGAAYLEQTIQSVLGQTYKNIEYIIVDGGSEDGTLDIVRRYEEHLAYWISEPDGGLFYAMNKGMGLATGSVIGMVNSDDWYAPDAVEAAVRAIDGHDVVCGNICRVYTNFEVVVRPRFDRRRRRCFCPHPAVFVRAEVYRSKLFDTRYAVAGDIEFFLDLYLRLGVQFRCIDQVLTCMRAGGWSGQHRLRGYKELLGIRARFGDWRGVAQIVWKLSKFLAARTVRYVGGPRFYDALRKRVRERISL
ncbi:MAG: glycosyltransferase [Candidatus Hydrogenedentes bacterium]|nr:glycosyltransferase [Candidatus Hydrogenedentota bacterium]